MTLATPHAGSGTPPAEERPVSEVRGARWALDPALACYAELSRMMRSPRWKRLLRAHAERLREARELEAPVLELLALGEEGKSPRTLRQRRARLEVLARKRLARFTRRGGASLGEVLGSLEALVREPVPQPPGRDEPVLLEGAQGWRHLLAWPGSWVFALLTLTNRHWMARLGHPGPLLVAGGAFLLYFHLRCSGRFWLTSKRLMWQPRFGEPVQVSLESIAPGGISALPAWGEVRVEGHRSFTVRHAGHAGRLAALLDLHRRPPFLGAVDGSPRVVEVSVLPASRRPEPARSGQRAEPGVAVLRPGYAAFLPAHRHAEIFRSLAGPEAQRPDADATVELLVEHMRLLPEAEFDARMRQAVLASGGELWHADEVRSGSAPVKGAVHRFSARGMGLDVQTDSAQAEATDRIVRRWAA